MCTVENRAMYGVFRENPFHFKHNNLETLTVSVDSDTLIHLTLILTMEITSKPTTLLCILQDNIKVTVPC